MTNSQLHRRYLTLQQAVDDVLGSTGSEEKDVVILPPAQGDAYATDVEEDDVDECHKNDFLPTVLQELQRYITTMNAKSLPTYHQVKVKKTNHRQRKRERMRKQCSGRRKAVSRKYQQQMLCT